MLNYVMSHYIAILWMSLELLALLNHQVELITPRKALRENFTISLLYIFNDIFFNFL